MGPPCKGLRVSHKPGGSCSQWCQKQCSCTNTQILKHKDGNYTWWQRMTMLPSSGGWGRRTVNLRPTWAIVRHCSKTTNTKFEMEWRSIQIILKYGHSYFLALGISVDTVHCSSITCLPCIRLQTNHFTPDAVSFNSYMVHKVTLVMDSDVTDHWGSITSDTQWVKWSFLWSGAREKGLCYCLFVWDDCGRVMSQSMPFFHAVPNELHI